MKTNDTRFFNPQSLARFLRRYQGMSMGKVAKACGLAASEVWRFERGCRNMGTGKVERLAAFFGVDIDDLLYDRYDDVFSSLPDRPQRSRFLQKRLRDRQKKRDKLGQDGEAYVAHLEREKLAGTKYEKGVNEAIADDLSAGYDIQSFTRDGVIIYIEVKTTSGEANEPFFLSANEKSFMEYCYANGHRYELHRVFNFRDGAHPRRIIYTAEDMMGFTYEPRVYMVKGGA